MNITPSPSASSNASGSASSCQRSSNTREGEDDRRPARAATPQQAETFAKLLRHKAGDTDGEPQNPLAAGLFAPPRPEPSPTQLAQSAPSGVQAAPPSATADAMRCAQVHGVAAAAPLAGSAAAPSSWEVRLGDPLTGGLQLRATSSGTAAAVLAPVAPTWELSLASSQIGAHTLARHAPRLSERLRAHGVDHDGVQVQGSRQRHTPEDETGDELA